MFAHSRGDGNAFCRHQGHRIDCNGEGMCCHDGDRLKECRLWRIKRESVEDEPTSRENERSEALLGNSWSLGGFPDAD